MGPYPTSVRQPGTHPSMASALAAKSLCNPEAVLTPQLPQQINLWNLLNDVRPYKERLIKNMVKYKLHVASCSFEAQLCGKVGESHCEWPV